MLETDSFLKPAFEATTIELKIGLQMPIIFAPPALLETQSHYEGF